ncbi:MAG: hypothetical protein U9R56_05460, partial [candidate division Zixibacteria bacterium]|nr:hypothetical protein [candidate division Zixibacteria bacterium]
FRYSLLLLLVLAGTDICAVTSSEPEPVEREQQAISKQHAHSTNLVKYYGLASRLTSQSQLTEIILR